MIERLASSNTASSPAREVRAAQGRYRVESELSRGAMGAVYRAYDTVNGRMIALKRSLSAEPRYLRMFEREYHTLVGLTHPRIIEVYDYGVDESGAYYSMELLKGRDLGTLAPLDYRKAARYLRDVASSLGLLHARRLLHRDLSPRNVYVVEDDRCKLLDFGALSGFGVPDLVVGTPPFVPPESLHGLSLDQRADLYALGAVAYAVLTGKHAYHARTLEALPRLWKKLPPRPSKLVAELNNPELPAIPPELDDLVMSLLTLDRLGRPASAAEVIDRLTRIADLPEDKEGSAAASSYLVGVPTVGRAREHGRLREKLEQTLGGRGSHVVIEARPGMGSTRVLHDLVVESQLAGAFPLLIDAAAGGGPFAAVHQLIAKLLITAHDRALAALKGHEAILSRFSPTLRAALRAEPDTTDFSLNPGEFRQRVLAALSDWLLRLCTERALVLAVDNAERLDDASAALLAALTGEGLAKRRLLLVVSLDPEQLKAAAPALRPLTHGNTRVSLRALSREDVTQLVRSWFGGAEHGERLAALLYRVSGGNPRACVELAEHLVRNRIVRDIQGAWVLPFALQEDELPSSVHAVQAARIDSLSEPERRMLEALAVHRGRVPLALCLEIAEAEQIAEPYAVIEALTRENVLSSAGKSYSFSYDALQQAILASLSDARKRELHRRIGALIAERGDGSLASQLDAGWHLLHGGERERGAAMLAAAGLQVGYSSDDMASAVPALRAALSVYREGNHDDYDRVPLLGLLAMAGFFSDRRLAAEFGPEAVAAFERVLNLPLQRKLAKLLGERLAFFAAIGLAAVRFMLRGRGGVTAFRSLIVQFVSCVTVLVATAAVCMDPKAALALAERMAPLRNLGKDAAPAYAYRFALLLAAAPRERVVESLREARLLLARLESTKPIQELPAAGRAELHAGILRVIGMMELFCFDSQTLEIAKRLDQTGMIDHKAVADQLRLSYHALRGEIAIAESFRSQVELHAVQAGRIWQNEVWAPSFFILVYTSTLDTIGLKDLAERLDRLAEEIPTLRYDATMVRAEYHHAKGDHEQAFALSKPVLEATEDRAFIGRSNAMATFCRGLNQSGRFAEAKATLLPLIARLSDDDRRVALLYVNLERELARAHAGLGEHADAARVIRAALERYADSKHPLLLGNLHSTAVDVALAASDNARAAEHARQVERWFRGTDNPVLIAQVEKLLRRVRAQSGAPEEDKGRLSDADKTQQTSGWQTSLSQMSQLRADEERADFALRLVREQIRSSGGYLFAVRDGEPLLIAPRHGEEPSEALLARVRAAAISSTRVEHEVETDEVETRAQTRAGLGTTTTEARYQIYALDDDDSDSVLGVLAVLVPPARVFRQPRPEFLRALGRALFPKASTQTREELQERAGS